MTMETEMGINKLDLEYSMPLKFEVAKIMNNMNTKGRKT